jgi:hypothetical protein
VIRTRIAKIMPGKWSCFPDKSVHFYFADIYDGFLLLRYKHAVDSEQIVLSTFDIRRHVEKLCFEKLEAGYIKSIEKHSVLLSFGIIYKGNA